MIPTTEADLKRSTQEGLSFWKWYLRQSKFWHWDWKEIGPVAIYLLGWIMVACGTSFGSVFGIATDPLYFLLFLLIPPGLTAIAWGSYRGMR